MKILAIPLVALAIIFGLAVAGPLHDRWQDSNEYRRQADALALERQQTQLQDWQAQQQATAASRALVGNMGYLGAGLAGVLLLMFLVDYYRQRRQPLARFGGELVSRRQIEDGDLIALLADRIRAAGIAQIEEARRPNVPHIYSPHLIQKQTDIDLPEIDRPALPTPELALLPGECTLAGLQRTNIIGRSGNSIHIGNAVADGTPIYLELATWGALALGGKSRTGKTSRITYYLCQAHLNGWKLIICDKHGGGGKDDALMQKIGPLEESFLLAPASSQADINTRIQQTYQIGKRRLEKHDRTSYPILLVVDEFTNLILNDWLEEKTLNQLMAISNEMAGVNVHCFVIGHDWGASCLGKERGAAFRRITTHRIAHRLDAQGAQFLLPSGMGKMAEGLPTGRAVYVDDNGEPVIVDCPFMRDEDIDWAAEHPGTWRGAKPGATSVRGRFRPGADDDFLASELGIAPAGADKTMHQHSYAENERFDQVRALLRKKTGITEILSIVWHLDPKERGAAYRSAMEEYREIVAALVERAA